MYYDRMKKLFTRGKLEDVKHRWFLLCLCLDIKKFSIMNEGLCEHGSVLVAVLEVK